MRLGKVDFPEPVVAAARNRELVVFAGAGVSMGKPAGVPGFRALTEKIAKKSGERELDIKKSLGSISPDAYLGQLKSRGTNVHALAAKELSKPGIRHTELHRVLLRLYPRPEAVRVVTTNFDRLFEQAAGDVFPAPAMPETHSFPNFPVARDFRGIVHLHGDVAHPSGMVLTDGNFGAAYVSRDPRRDKYPRAQEFVTDLLSTNTLLFVGYSGDDVIFQYLTRGLLSAESPRHFAMVRVEDEQKWLERGIQAVLYPASLSDPDGALCESLSSLAEHARASVAEQRSRIGELASQPPSELNREQIDLVADALSDPVRRKFFTRVAGSPEWITWLDERKYLNALFGDEDLSASDRDLAEWIAEKFVHDSAEDLFALIGKHELRLHSDFWEALLWQAQIPADSPIDRSCLERWVSLLLSTVPSRIDRASALNLFFLGERCIEHKLTNSVAEIFEVLADSRLVPEKFSSLRRDAGEPGLGIDAELSSAAGSHELSKLWRKGLWPQRSQMANRLFPIIVENLAKQHRMLCVWDKASQRWDPTSFRRSAIEPHDQDRYPKAADVIIDAARDCLQWLAEHKRDAALYWCGRLVGEQAPLLRRLAVHTLTELSDVFDFGPDEKIDWLLSRIDINGDDVHHEIFRAMQFIYPRASQPRRQAVVSAVLDFQPPQDKDPDGDIAAYARFNWFHWLHSKASDCDLARKERAKIQAEYPEFRPREHPDFQTWSCTGGIAQRVALHSPWSSNQLLAESAGHWVSRLLEYRPEEFPLKGSPWERQGLCEEVGEAAKKNFGWGVDLADALAKKKVWESDLWPVLLRAWVKADEDKILKRNILRHLFRDELGSNHPRAISDLLLEWAKSGQHTKLLDGAERVAVEMWPVLSQDPERHLPFIEPSPDWLTEAINCPPGVLAEFWLVRLGADGLRGKCRTALSAITQDRRIGGRLGRTVLASNFPALLHKDEEWVRRNLLPFFEFPEDEDAKDCQAVWEGFLYRAYIDARIFSLLETAFHTAVEQLQGTPHFLTGELRAQFLSACARIVTDKHLVPDPLDKWLPSVLRNCGAQDIGIFTREIGRFLNAMSEEEREESWLRWLKEYWQLRRDGAIAGYLTREETTGMFHWLPFLRGGAFSEAVNLAVQTSPAPHLRHRFLFRELDEAGLLKEQPETVARLFLYLGEAEADKAEASRYARRENGKIIRKLLALEIPAELQSRLKNLAAFHDIPIAEASAA